MIPPRLRDSLVRLGRLIGVGALTLAPLFVTLWVAWLLVKAIAALGGIFFTPFTAFVGRDTLEQVAADAPVLVLLVQVGMALVVLALAGALAESLAGRAVTSAALAFIGRTPVAGAIYRAVHQLLESFRNPAEDSRRVVLIAFPSPDMKAVGLVTRRFTAADTGEPVAAVYVPTTPNPSSGYVEIVPEADLVWLDWTTQEAIQFIVSGGVVGPERIDFGLRPGRTPPPPTTD